LLGEALSALALAVKRGAIGAGARRRHGHGGAFGQFREEQVQSFLGQARKNAPRFVSGHVCLQLNNQFSK